MRALAGVGTDADRRRGLTHAAEPFLALHEKAE